LRKENGIFLRPENFVYIKIFLGKRYFSLGKSADVAKELQNNIFE